MADQTLTFVHISDTHFGPTADFQRHDVAPLPCARRLVETINTLPVRPDFIVHTGDVTSDPEPAAYRLAARTLGQLQAPVYYVNGNHDTAAAIRQYMTLASHTPAGSDPDRLSYTFTVKGYRFLVLDARGPDDIDPHGILDPSQLELVAQEATPDGPPLTVFVHFPVLPLNSPWMDANMLILNGEELHQALLPARTRLRGVFHGHVHQPMQTVRDGIIYFSVASAFFQFGAWPNDLVTSYDPDHLPGFAFVHLLPDQTIVHQHTFPRP
ncbi:MAG: metallophosphoesterase [Candidatus Promineifilaceae bacterium]|nr:metallophosphoesterase [Candidatus Promineifilaceae bacterium]